MNFFARSSTITSGFLAPFATPPTQGSRLNTVSIRVKLSANYTATSAFSFIPKISGGSVSGS